MDFPPDVFGIKLFKYRVDFLWIHSKVISSPIKIEVFEKVEIFENTDFFAKKVEMFSKKCFFLVRTLPSALQSIWKNLFFHLWTIKKKKIPAKKNSENLKSYTNISKKDGCEIWTRRHYHVPIKIRDFIEKMVFFCSYASECPPEHLEKIIFSSLN